MNDGNRIQSYRLNVEELIAACRAAPDDDAPRLVWADAIGGERGELVVLQCMPPTPARIARVTELLAARGAAWANLSGLAKRCTFRRGFVEAVEVELADCVARADEIAARAPLLESLGLACPQCTRWEDDQFDGPDTVGLVKSVLQHPALAHVRGFVFDKAQLTICPDRESAYQSGYGDEIVELAVELGRLQQLRSLGFVDCRLGRRGVDAIGRGTCLEELVLGEGFGDWDWQDPNPPPITWPADALPNLRTLYVRAIDDATRTRLRPAIEIVVGAPPPEPGVVDLS